MPTASLITYLSIALWLKEFNRESAVKCQPMRKDWVLKADQGQTMLCSEKSFLFSLFKGLSHVGETVKCSLYNPTTAHPLF